MYYFVIGVLYLKLRRQQLYFGENTRKLEIVFHNKFISLISAHQMDFQISDEIEKSK